MRDFDSGRRIVRLGASRALLITALTAAGIAPAVGQGRNGGAFASAIDSLIRSLPHDKVDTAALRRLYDLGAHRPLWTRDERPTSQALELLAFIDSASVRGLRPSDYHRDSLHAVLATIQHNRSVSSSDSAHLAIVDMLLSRALVHLLADLDHGRIPPTTVGFHIPARQSNRDLPAIAFAVAESEIVSDVLGSVEPQYAGYASLTQLLARYRTMAADSSLVLPRHERTIRPGDYYADAPRLRRLLAALGDLPSSAADTAEPNRYAGALVLAVQRFQRRHGLTVDGTLGPATRAALQVPLATRVRQIELALERWR